MVNLVEYEFVIYLFLTFVDIIFATFYHIYVKKDANSGKAKIGAAKKLLILLFMALCLVVYDLDRFIPFGDGLVKAPVIAQIKAAIIAIFAYMCYFEFVSVAANFSLLSGVDLTKIPGVKAELKDKRGK